MDTIKCLGIWLDHSKAILIEGKTGELIETIELTSTHQSQIDSPSNNESGMHHKEQQTQTKYYERIGEEILKFNKVLLFGPTDAKLELHNFLMTDNHFKDIKIDVQSADKMTGNQQIAFVKAHFI